MKLATKKGFTLIELMIVIVILGILMSTVLPRLTGAQARGRDTGRVADLGNISAAMQVYYDDYGQFPAATNHTDAGECLGESGDSATDAISGYLKAGDVPKDPSRGANGTLCTAAADNLGKYWYKPLTKSAVANNAFVLCSDAETFQKANTLLPGHANTVVLGGGAYAGTDLDTTWTSFEEMATAVGQVDGDNMLTSDADDQTLSIYCVLGG